jgi:hypothetical protein
VQRRGVSYDVGRVLGLNWRPVFDPSAVRRELEVIQDDLHCNAVRICGRDIGRLVTAAQDALGQGLEVWLSPELWNKGQPRTLAYLAKAAAAAEDLRQRWPEKVVLSVASEATLFTQGIVPGRSLASRLGRKSFWADAKAGKHNAPLNRFLALATRTARKSFQGPLTYASLIWEDVDWSQFDYVGVDHYRDGRIKDKYTELLKPLLDQGKPVIITEFGMRAYQGAENGGTLGLGIVDNRSLFLHHLPLVGDFIPARLNGNYVRDEDLQATELAETLQILDAAGVDGAFVCTFADQLLTYDPNPRHDLDMSSFGLVKSLPKGQKGTTYPGMPWEPKKAFDAVASFYASQQDGA